MGLKGLFREKKGKNDQKSDHKDYWDDKYYRYPSEIPCDTEADLPSGFVI